MVKLLLHTCCAPCAVAVIDELRQRYDLTVFFYNPNIFPKEEYEKRKAEVVKVCQEWGISMIDADYETEKWNEATVGLDSEPEGGKRCYSCFNLRLSKAANYAAKNDFKIFASTLTSGRNKKAETINAIGEKLAEERNLKFLSENWKSNGRQEKGKKMVQERGIYRQNYCGCRHSI